MYNYIMHNKHSDDKIEYHFNMAQKYVKNMLTQLYITNIDSPVFLPSSISDQRKLVNNGPVAGDF